MFERIVAFLLRLYPEEFRRVYGRDALQLIRDRAGHERGVLLRARLLMDLARDLLVTSLSWRPPATVLARIEGTPRFDILEPHRPRPEALVGRDVDLDADAGQLRVAVSAQGISSRAGAARRRLRG